MARVPLYNGGILPQAPNGARVPLPPEMRATQVAIPTQGREWAGALAQTGQLFQQLAFKQAEANDTRQLIEAEGMMRKHQMEFQQFQQQQPDQEQWLPEWQKRQTSLQEHIDGLNLTDGARLRLTQSFSRWSDNHAVEVQGQAFKQAVGRAKQAVINRANEGALSGNDGEIESALSLLPQEYTTPEDRDALRLSLMEKARGVRLNQLNSKVSADLNEVDRSYGLEAAKESVRSSPDLTDIEKREQLNKIDAQHASNLERDEVQALSINDPVAAIAALNDPEKFKRIPPGDRAAMIVNAKQVQASFASDIFQDVKTRIGLGQVAEGESFDGEPFKPLTPIMRDVLKAMNAQRTQKDAMNNPARYEMALAGISKYDATQDEGGLGRANLGAMLEASFSGTYLDELKSRLDAKASGKAGEGIDAAPAIALLGEWTDGGGLGNYKAPVTVNGSKVMSEPKKIGVTETTPRSLLGIDWLMPDKGGDEVKSESRPITEENPVQKAQAANKQAAIRKQLEGEVKSGKFKSNDEVTARMLELYQQRGGTVPAIPQAGVNALLPALDTPKKELRVGADEAMRIINFKPSK